MFDASKVLIEKKTENNTYDSWPMNFVTKLEFSMQLRIYLVASQSTGARGGAVVIALACVASRDRRLRVRSRSLPYAGHSSTLTSPEVGGPNGETAVYPPKWIC